MRATPSAVVTNSCAPSSLPKPTFVVHPAYGLAGREAGGGTAVPRGAVVRSEPLAAAAVFSSVAAVAACAAAAARTASPVANTPNSTPAMRSDR